MIRIATSERTSMLSSQLRLVGDRRVGQPCFGVIVAWVLVATFPGRRILSHRRPAVRTSTAVAGIALRPLCAQVCGSCSRPTARSNWLQRVAQVWPMPSWIPAATATEIAGRSPLRPRQRRGADLHRPALRRPHVQPVLMNSTGARGIRGDTRCQPSAYDHAHPSCRLTPAVLPASRRLALAVGESAR